MSKRILMTLLVAVVALGFLGSSALAEMIVHHPVASNQSSFYSTGSLSQDAYNLWNEFNNDSSNPAEVVVRPDLADPSTWYISSFQNQGWMSANSGGDVSTEWVVLDLGEVCDLDAIYLWNYNHHITGGLPARGIREFEVWKADDLAGTVTATESLYAGTLAESSTNVTPSYYDGKFDLTGATDVRYVKINVVSDHGDANYVGLGFVTFEKNIVPEPGTLALFACGLLGLLAYAWRKRK